MRTRRLKIHGEAAVYHLISRTVAGQKLLNHEDKEVFRKQIRQMAAFCGIEILTYCILSNHFHLLVRVPPPLELADSELVRRYAILYGDEEALALERNLSTSERAPEIRARLLKRMHDVSFFMKELKMRFTIYYNKKHDRFGTFWAERFKSLLIESAKRPGTRNALLTVAAYIDLNPVRAGLCSDPKEYRYCGYGEALGRGSNAVAGICHILGRANPAEALQEYRVVLFGSGVVSDRTVEGGIDWKTSRKVLERRGKLPGTELLRCRVRYFTDGLALGSEKFIAMVRERLAVGTQRPGKTPKLPATDGEELCFARRQRHRPGRTSV